MPNIIYGLATLLAVMMVMPHSLFSEHQEKKVVGSGMYTTEDQGWSDYTTLKALQASREKLIEFITAYPKSELADEALYLAATKQINDNDNIKALALLDRIITEYPNSAYCCVEIPFPVGGSLPGAEKVKTHIRSYPNYTPDVALLLKCKALEAVNKAPEATNLLQAYVDNHPEGRWSKEDREIRMKLAGSLLRINRTDEEIFLTLGRIHIENKNFEEGEKVFSRAMQAFKYSHEEWRYCTLLAKTQREQRKQDDEIKTLEQLRSLLKENRGPMGVVYVNAKGETLGTDILEKTDRITLEEVEGRIKELQEQRER